MSEISRTPWSPLAEKEARERRTLMVLMGLAFLAMALFAAIKRDWSVLALEVVLGFVSLFAARETAQELRAMLANRPRSGSTAGLTPWTRHEDVTSADCRFPSGMDVSVFYVWCDRLNIPASVLEDQEKCCTRVKLTWHPNPVDPGGGRYAGVCPRCGEGHYFFRIPGQ